jgi:Tol biopolymer transport system component
VAGKTQFVGAIALFDPATGALVRDLTTGHADRDPTFSPDGKQVAFTRNGDLYVVKVASGAPKLVRHGVREPTWASR